MICRCNVASRSVALAFIAPVFIRITIVAVCRTVQSMIYSLSYYAPGLCFDIPSKSLVVTQHRTMGLKLCESTQTHYRRSHTAIIGCYRSPLRSSTTASIHLKATVSNISAHAPSCRATIGASKTINSSVEWLGKRTCDGDGGTEGVPTLEVKPNVWSTFRLRTSSALRHESCATTTYEARLLRGTRHGWRDGGLTRSVQPLCSLFGVYEE